MPSEAYKKALRETPKHIQKSVTGSLDIANEIYLALKNNNLNAADLARMLNKSESEISKWLTGTHNFTYKTIARIESVLNTSILITRSCKIDDYETKIFELTKEVSDLKFRNKNLINHLNVNFFGNLKFDQSIDGSYYFSSGNSKQYISNFNSGKKDTVKIEPQSQSMLSYTIN